MRRKQYDDRKKFQFNSKYSNQQWLPNYDNTKGNIQKKSSIIQKTSLPKVNQNYKSKLNQSLNKRSIRNQSIFNNKQSKLTASSSLSIKNNSENSEWLNKYQIGTRSRIKKQYQKYFIDCENVFYQDSTRMRINAIINFLLPILGALLTILIISYLIVYSVKGYDKACPKNATCGVYVHCHYGYVLNSKMEICQVDPQVRQTAQSIVDEIVQGLQYRYGDQECNETLKGTILQPPKISMFKVFENLQFTNELSVLRTEITKIFEDKNLQKIAGFGRDSLGLIYPTKKMNLFIQNHPRIFLSLLFFSLISLIGMIFYLYNYKEDRKALKIYNYLKETLKQKQKKQIDFGIYRQKIEQDFNSNMTISQDLWLKINNWRIKQKVIGSYQDDTVKWRVISQI